MKKILIFISLSLFYFSNAFAITLLDALNQTYKNNIQLNAERENIKVSKEDIKISEADYKPSLTLSGSKSLVRYVTAPELLRALLRINTVATVIVAG